MELKNFDKIDYEDFSVEVVKLKCVLLGDDCFDEKVYEKDDWYCVDIYVVDLVDD